MYTSLHSQALNYFKMHFWNMVQLCTSMIRYSVMMNYLHLAIDLSFQNARTRYVPSFCRQTIESIKSLTSADIPIVSWCSTVAEPFAVNGSSQRVCTTLPLVMVFEKTKIVGATNSQLLLRYSRMEATGSAFCINRGCASPVHKAGTGKQRDTTRAPGMYYSHRQHYDYCMSEKFFDELDIPAPDY